MTSRRHFLQTVALSSAAGFGARSGLFGKEFSPQIAQVPELAGKLGLVSASLTKFIAAKPDPALGQFALLDFPKILRDELDLTVADLNTMNFPTLEPAYAEKLRAALDAAGCVGTNLKMNQRVDFASADPAARAEAMRAYKQSVDAAAILGLRWVRPLPRNDTPDAGRLRAAFDELIDYAGERGLTVLLENFGWMMSDADSVVKLADTLGRDRVAVGPDTGNWKSNEIRYPGLAKTFPLAVTCDFKARPFGPGGEHPEYDIRRCFDLGWDAGFRGPWCFEHGDADRDRAFRGIARLRDWVREWTRERSR